MGGLRRGGYGEITLRDPSALKRIAASEPVLLRRSATIRADRFFLAGSPSLTGKGMPPLIRHFYYPFRSNISFGGTDVRFTHT